MSELTDAISTYAYTSNNPIMMNDPMGDYAPGEARMPDWYGPRMRDILDRYWQDPFSSGWNRGDGGGSPFSSYNLYMGVKSHLSSEGIPSKIGFNKRGVYGYWENFVGNEYETGVGAMRGVTVGTRFMSLNLPFYETPEAAAKGWGLLFNESSIRDDKEYGGAIFSYPINGEKYYSFNVPNIGTSRNVNLQSIIPKGATMIGWIHSHAAYKNWTDNYLSYQGLSYIVQDHYDIDQYRKDTDEGGGAMYFMFVTTPSGYLKAWEPGQGSAPVPTTLYNYSTGGSLKINSTFSPGKSDAERGNLSPVFLVPITNVGMLGKPRKL